MGKSVLKLRDESGFTVEFDFGYCDNVGDFVALNPSKKDNLMRIAELDLDIGSQDEKIDELNQKIDCATNKADNFDYIMAVVSGILTGTIDIFYVGELDLESAKDKVHEIVNKYIEHYAKDKGYKGEGLKGAIAYLERMFPVDQDNVFLQGGSSTKHHHLDDLAHHPTIVGMLAAIIVQFFRCGIFVDKDGSWHFVLLDTKPEELLKTWAPVFISGILLWLTNLATNKLENKYGKEIPKPLIQLVKLIAASPVLLKILSVLANWKGHLISDLGGSKSTPDGGMGIPGIFISILKELASLSPFCKKELNNLVNDLYVKQKIDFRQELAIMLEMGKQAIPVAINEVLVRIFYFVRRLIVEFAGYKSIGDIDWKNINWKDMIPFGNRTIGRMVTIAAGTFTMIDMADAGIRALKKFGGKPPIFWSMFALRVNFVGIGRFVFAFSNDLYMGYTRKRLIAERMTVRNVIMVNSVTKMYYYENNMWIAAYNATNSLLKTYILMQDFCKEYDNLDKQFKKSGEEIDRLLLDRHAKINQRKRLLEYIGED